MGQVANLRTPLTYAQALGTLLAAGAPPAGLLMIAAQSAVETAGWQAMNNYNFGNVTPSASQIAAGIDWMTQNVPNMRFISYSDPVSGAKGMLGWLQTHGLLAYAAANDLTGYMGKLSAGCYLGCIGNTDPSNGRTISQTDYDNYRAGISAWMSKLSKVAPAAPPMVVASNLMGPVLLGLAGLGGIGLLAAYDAGYFDR
jgi:hypothetical protein